MARKLLGCASGMGLALSLLAVSGHAQTAPVKAVEIKFGKPEPADFEAKNFVADSAAKAVVLYDGGAVRFRVDGLSFKMDIERTTRIKILKKSGYDYATVQVPLYHRDGNEEKITSLKGFTYNEIGGKVEKVKLDGANMFTEERSKNVRVRKFTLPNVREGAVIEYAYTVTSDFFFNLDAWTFQRDIPTRWSEFHALIPEYFSYKMLMQGYEPLALQKKEETSTQFVATERVQVADGAGSINGSLSTHSANSSEAIQAHATSYVWAMQNVPALHEEPFMTTTDDYVARINFELAGTRMPGGTYHDVTGNWVKINEDLLHREEFGMLLDRGGFLKEQVQPLVAQHADLAARAAAVRELVLHNVKYDGTNRQIATGSLKHTWEQHRGTSADVNLLLIAALRQAGLPAQPVILSTRAHGRVSQSFPLLEQFNYVVALLPLEESKELLLDATEPLLPAGLLPTRCLNQVGRLIPSQGGEGRWVDLTPVQRHQHFQNIKLTLDAQGNLSGQVSEEHSGYAGATIREKLQQLGEKKYVTELAARHGWEVPTYKFDGTSEPGHPLKLSYELRQTTSSAQASPELYLNPLAAFVEAQNPFKEETRTYPVDFGAMRQEVVMLTLSLPAGYTAELPASAALALPDKGGRYLFSATSPSPGTVVLVSRFTLDKPIYGAEEYGSLREFYRQALAKQAQALVLKKQ